MNPNTAAAPAGRVFKRDLRIEWGDCDPARIVFYPRYLAFFDANTAYLFEAAGCSKAELMDRYGIVGLPLADVQAKFSMPCSYGDHVSIESRILEWRGFTVIVEHRLTRAGELAVRATETRVWAISDPQRPGALKPQPIPQEVIDRFRV